MIYTMNGKEYKLYRTNTPSKLYYWSDKEKEGALEKIPEGYEVVEGKLGRMPVLRKIKDVSQS